MEINASVKELSPELQSVLVCPLDHGTLKYDHSHSTLVCQKCSRAYPVVNGIPNMLVKG